MHIETHGHQIEVTPALRDYVETRFERLARHRAGAALVLHERQHHEHHRLQFRR